MKHEVIISSDRHNELLQKETILEQGGALYIENVSSGFYSETKKIHIERDVAINRLEKALKNSTLNSELKHMSVRDFRKLRRRL